MQRLPKQEPIGLLIGAARRRLKQAVGTRVKPHHLSPQQFWVLVGVAEQERGSQGALAARLRLDAPTASRIVGALVKRGLVRSVGDPGDRRRTCLELTARGATLAGRLLPLAQEARLAVVGGLSEQDQATLRELLQRVIASLERFENQTGQPG